MTRILLTLALTASTGGLALAGVLVPVPRLPGHALRQAVPKPPQPPDDPATIAARISMNTKTAANRLANKDAGAGTQKTQKQTLKDIDELLKQAENPPPKSGDSGGGSQNDSPPQGGGNQQKGGDSQQKNGGKSKSPRGSRSERKPQGGQPSKADQQSAKQGPTPAGPMPRPGQPGGKQPATQTGVPLPGVGGKGLPLDDPVAKQVWGHLPERLRQQMSQYYREQFMPKYSPLIRDYFSALAEREKKK